MSTIGDYESHRRLNKIPEITFNQTVGKDTQDGKYYTCVPIKCSKHL